jgi:hypothetical protein
MRPESSDEQEYLSLTTRGRKSGSRRQVEIWFTQKLDPGHRRPRRVSLGGDIK